MKAAIRIAVLLIAIVGLTLSGFNASSTQAFNYCNAPVWQAPPSGYRFVQVIQCDGEEIYELWENSGGGAYIRVPS